MNKALSLLLTALATTTLLLPSCVKKAESNEGSEEAQKVDTIWNEKIQDTFFGVKFGAPRQEVIDSLTAHGFTMDTDYSDNKNFIHFVPPTNHYSFGGLTFEHLNVYFNNDKFESIEFYDCCGEIKNKQAKNEAIANAENYANALDGKYKLTKTKIKEEDSTSVYYRRAVFAKNGTIKVCANKGKSIGGDEYYYSNLLYVSKSVSEEPNKEL